MAQKSRGMLVKLVDARSLELLIKTKEKHNIKQAGKPDFRDGGAEMGCNVTLLHED